MYYLKDANINETERAASKGGLLKATNASFAEESVWKVQFPFYKKDENV